MRANSKGEVIIPKPLLEQIGVASGGEVEIGVDGDTIRLRRVESVERREMTRGERFVDSIAGTATANRDLSTDEIMKLLRGDD